MELGNKPQVGVLISCRAVIFPICTCTLSVVEVLALLNVMGI